MGAVAGVELVSSAMVVELSNYLMNMMKLDRRIEWNDTAQVN
jgi:hypothetical protein